MMEDFIDPSKRSQKELILKLLDEMETMKAKVDKYLEGDSQKLAEQIKSLEIQIAVIQSKAAILGAVAGTLISALISYLMK